MIIAINMWLLNNDTDDTFVENGADGQKRALNTFRPASSRHYPRYIPLVAAAGQYKEYTPSTMVCEDS